MIVADTNLVVYPVISGPQETDAQRVRSRDHDWVAPVLLRSELLNVLWRYVTAGLIGRDEAIRTYKRGLSFIRFATEVSDPAGVLNLCQATGCSTYDAEFVWLAQERGTTLVTLDGAVLRAFRSVAVLIADFAAGR